MNIDTTTVFAAQNVARHINKGVELENPLKNVPLNTGGVYVFAKTKSGCEIIMPVDSRDDKVIHEKKDALQRYLDATT